MIHATDHFADRVHERVAPDADPAEIAAGIRWVRKAICRKCKEVTGERRIAERRRPRYWSRAEMW